MAMPLEISRKIIDFFDKYPLKTYEKGEIIMFPNEDLESIIYLRSGRVREYDISTNGDEVVVNVFKPPAFFPMSWAISKLPNRYFFSAAVKTTGNVAPPEDVLDFIKNNPDVMLDLLKRLYIGVDGMRRRMAHLMSGSAKTRLLFELVLECRRFGVKQKNDEYRLEVSESELGSRAGLSRETVSREMKDFKKSGFISVSRKEITIHDLASLNLLLGSEL
jgi:CRP-like cAMP-binding protein